MPRETDAQIEERAERNREAEEHRRAQAKGYLCACEGPFHRRYCPVRHELDEEAPARGG